MSTRKDTKGFLLGAIAGGVIGSIAALLLAPKPGKDLRQDISVGAQKVGDTTIKAAGKVGETTGRIAKEIGGQASHIATLGKKAAVSVASSVRSFRKNTDLQEDAATITGTSSTEQITAAQAAEDPVDTGMSSVSEYANADHRQG